MQKNEPSLGVYKYIRAIPPGHGTLLKAFAKSIIIKYTIHSPIQVADDVEHKLDQLGFTAPLTSETMLTVNVPVHVTLQTLHDGAQSSREVIISTLQVKQKAIHIKTNSTIEMQPKIFLKVISCSVYFRSSSIFSAFLISWILHSQLQPIRFGKEGMHMAYVYILCQTCFFPPKTPKYDRICLFQFSKAYKIKDLFKYVSVRID